MITIEYFKQLDDIILAESNIEILSRSVGMTERGPLTLQYFRLSRRYFWQVGEGPHIPAKDETVITLLMNEKKP